MEVEEELEALEATFSGEVQWSKADPTTSQCSYSVCLNHENRPILTLQLDDSYPATNPVVLVPSHLQSVGLKEHVLSAIPTESEGSPVLYHLIDAAREWVRDHPLNIQQAPPATAAADKSSKVPLCKFFIQGKCRFGDKCRNSHATGGSTSVKKTTPAAVAATAGDDKKDKKTNQEVNSKQKGKPTRDVSNGEKKIPMRTSEEVISRILWDPDLPSEQFTVGYLDRFVGIIEKPFNSFSWEDLATVGNNVLAVPKHRIQYFKYRGEIVWDKRSQTDDFFGSRGGRLIQDIIAEQSPSQKKEDVQTEESEGTEAQLIEDEDDVDEDGTTGASNAARVASDRNRPTHFVCIRITNPQVQAKAYEIQSYLTKCTPALAEGCLPISALHVTLCMVRLETDQHIARAREVMENVQGRLVHVLPRCSQLTFTGVSNFRQRLVYATVAPCSALENFVFFLIERFQEAGLRTPGNHKEYTAHMTLVKLTRPMQRDPHTSVLTPAMYEPFADTHIGSNRIETLSLCSMTAPKQEDGFYLRVCEVTNSLHSLPHHFVSALEKHIHSFLASEIISEEECGKLLASFRAGGRGEFDQAIEEVISLGQEDTTYAAVAHTTKAQAVIAFRGVPGSGKSFLATHCSEYIADSASVAICSADYYFMNGGEYRFSSKLLPQAHAHCQGLFLQALAEGKQLIVVDNTHSRKWEYEIYRYISAILGCSYHVLEVPCPSEKILDAYRSRNQHSIDAKTALSILRRWETDESASLVPPHLAYPRPTILPEYSLLSLCISAMEQSSEAVGKLEALKAVYTGVFLTPKSQWKLVAAVSPTHQKISADHVTLVFDPDPQTCLSTNIGHRVSLYVTGTVDNGKVQAAVVELPRGLVCHNPVPHISISAEENVPFKEANDALQKQGSRPICQSLELDGIIGVVVRERNELDDAPTGTVDTSVDVVSEEKPEPPPQPRFLIDSAMYFRDHVLPKLTSASGQSEVENVEICSGNSLVTRLYIFDFDDTLFFTPDARQGRKLYENSTGKKWRKKGWFTWPESLLPPLQSTPGPVLATLRDHLGQAGSTTIILTGRNELTRPGVLHVLENYAVYPDRLILKPDTGDEVTPVFKARIVKELLQGLPDINLVKFWDDNPRNLAAIHRLSMSSTFKNIQFEIVDATKMVEISATKQGKKMKVQASSQTATGTGVVLFPSVLESHLSACGYHATSAYQRAAEYGIRFIAEQFSKMIGYTGNALHLVYTSGSYPLGRRGDVDLCLLSPPNLTPNDCFEQLWRVLGDCGLTYLHKGYSTRCPRLKVMLEFPTAPPIDYDIVFTRISDPEFFHSPPMSQLAAPKVSTKINPEDSISRTTFTGVVLLHAVLRSIDGIIPVSQFGAVVEMAVQVLAAQRHKGNAYHCIRTFHIVKLLNDFVKLHRDTLKQSTNCDVIFREFVAYVAQLPDDSWKKLFGEFVPFEYIPKVRQIFQKASDIMTSTKEDKVSIAVYEELTSRSTTYPPDGYTLVKIILSGDNKVALWKLQAIVEARLPSYIRELISQGLDILPDGNMANKHRFAFAVQHTKSTKQMLQQVLRPFWNEISKFRKEEGVSISLTFGTPDDSKLSDKCSQAGAKESIPAIKKVNEFASDPTQTELLVSSDLTAYERMLVHEACEQLGLNHTTVIIRKEKCVLVKKTSS